MRNRECAPKSQEKVRSRARTLIHTLKPSNPQTLKPSNPQTLKPSNPQTLKPSNPQTLKPSNPQTLEPSNPQTLKPSNPQTLKPSNPQTLKHPQVGRAPEGAHHMPALEIFAADSCRGVPLELIMFSFLPCTQSLGFRL